VADDNATLREEVLYVAEAEMKAKVQPHGMSNDLSRETVARYGDRSEGSATESDETYRRSLLKLTTPNLEHAEEAQQKIDDHNGDDHAHNAVGPAHSLFPLSPNMRCTAPAARIDPTSPEAPTHPVSARRYGRQSKHARAPHLGPLLDLTGSRAALQPPPGRDGSSGCSTVLHHSTPQPD
jgi:hypothetical protein